MIYVRFSRRREVQTSAPSMKLLYPAGLYPDEGTSRT
jgi:hypothetical protein